MKSILESKFINKIWTKYGYNIFLVLGLLGIFLIFISEDSDTAVENNTVSTDVSQYRQELESNLETILSSVKGAGKVQIMITLESGEETVFAWQEKSTDDRQTVSADRSEQISQRTSYENEIVMIEKSSGNEALIEKILQPVVQGVVVVCEGADNITVVSDITNAVSVALAIPTNRVCVIKMQ